jgi:hypothetical protein
LSEPNEEHCKQATKNPSCPYLTTINELKADMAIVKKAFLGDILVKEPGLIEEIRDIKNAVKRKWTAKDYTTLLIGVAAFITAVVAAWPK